MAMGLLAVYDMAGVDIGINVHKANADKYPIDPTYYQAEVALGEHGRMGQKAQEGLLQIREGDRNRHDDPVAIEIIAKRAAELQVPQSAHTPEEIVERCLYPLINEGFHSRRGRRQCAPPTSTWSGRPATASRAIAAARCTMPRPSA